MLAALFLSVIAWNVECSEMVRESLIVSLKTQFRGILGNNFNISYLDVEFVSLLNKTNYDLSKHLKPTKSMIRGAFYNCTGRQKQVYSFILIKKLQMNFHFPPIHDYFIAIFQRGELKEAGSTFSARYPFGINTKIEGNEQERSIILQQLIMGRVATIPQTWHVDFTGLFRNSKTRWIRADASNLKIFSKEFVKSFTNNAVTILWLPSFLGTPELSLHYVCMLSICFCAIVVSLYLMSQIFLRSW